MNRNSRMTSQSEKLAFVLNHFKNQVYLVLDREVLEWETHQNPIN